MSLNDKIVELSRYDEKASRLLGDESDAANIQFKSDGVNEVALPYRAPYLRYQSIIQQCVNSNHSVLEIGSGIGAYTGILIRSGANVVASDISPKSLEVLRLRYESFPNLNMKVADMECLPFEDESFDVVCSVGSLSYGDVSLVLNEIHRVLRSGGCFICLDSLNHHPIYVTNRWIALLLGRRSRSTITRMPTLKTISLYQHRFSSQTVEYFGSMSWLMPFLTNFLGERISANFSDYFDSLIGVKYSAYKFIMKVVK